MNKTIQKNRDGRAMLAAIELGVLGPDALDARFRSNKQTMELLTYHGEKPHQGWRSYDTRRRECHTVQEGLHLEDPERFSEFKEHEKVQGMLNGIRVNSVDTTIEIVQYNDVYKNDYEKASAFILAAIGRHHEKNACTGRARNVSATGTKPTHNSWTPGKADKG